MFRDTIEDTSVAVASENEEKQDDKPADDSIELTRGVWIEKALLNMYKVTHNKQLP